MIYVIHWFVNLLTLGLVSIATITTTTYHVDEPITELNNQSLNDVFLDSNLITNFDFSNNINGWLNNQYTSWDNGSYKIIGSGTAIYIRGYQSNVFSNTSNYYYLRAEIYPTINSPSQVRLYDGYSHQNVVINNPTLNEKNIISGIRINYQLTTLFIDSIYTNTSLQSNAVINIDNVYVIDLTDLGIDNLSTSQMDDWYDIYVQANENNGVYIESSSHLNNNIHLVDVSVMVISFGFWVWLFKFLKGVIF